MATTKGCGLPFRWDVDLVKTPGGATGWAVGFDGAILRLQGGAWSQVASPTGNTLRAVDMVAASAAWAVGDAGVILQYGSLPEPLTAHLPLLLR